LIFLRLGHRIAREAQLQAKFRRSRCPPLKVRGRGRGGGASGNFDTPVGSMHEEGVSSLLNEAGKPLSAVAEAEEFAIPIFVVIFAIAIAVASLYVIYIAPLLLAEVMVDGVLSYALFRRVKGLESPHWIKTAIKRTFWPLVATAVTLCIAGALLSSYAPGSKSIGEAMSHEKMKDQE
jgi:hypothetical protein